MRSVASTLRALLRRLVRDRRGVAAVEFALILPIMLLVYLGGVEASSLIIVDRKVQTVAGALGDMVSRANGGITTAQLTDYFRGATAIMNPYSAADLTQIVTVVQVQANGTTSVVWSRKYQNGAMGNGPRAAGSAFTLPTEMLAVSRNNWVVVAEASKSYLPLEGLVIQQAIPLHRQNFYLPRFGKLISPPS